MIRSFALPIAAAVIALAAWGFWHYLGQEAIHVLSAVMIVLLAGDNFRIKRELSRCKQSKCGKKADLSADV